MASELQRHDDREVLAFTVEKRRAHRFFFHMCRRIQYRKPVMWENSMAENRLYLVLKTGKEPGRVDTRGRSQPPTTLREGNIYLLPRNQVYGLRFNPGMLLVAFHFQAVGLSDMDLFPDAGDILVHPEPAPWISIIRQALKGVDSVHGELALRQVATGLIWSFADQLDQSDDVLDRLTHRFPGLFQILAKTPPGQVKIVALARSENRSAESLSKAFRREAGFPLKDFLIKRTLEALKRQLTHTGDPVRIIADRLGFGSEDACSKFLKFHTGLSPLAYRKEQKNQEL